MPEHPSTSSSPPPALPSTEPTDVQVQRFRSLFTKLSKLSHTPFSSQSQIQLVQVLERRLQSEQHQLGLLRKHVLNITKALDELDSRPFTKLFSGGGATGDEKGDQKGERKEEFRNTIAREQIQERRVKRLERELIDAQKLKEDLLEKKLEYEETLLELDSLYHTALANFNQQGSTVERILTTEILAAESRLPVLMAKLENFKRAQRITHSARDLIEKSMTHVPGAKKFLDAWAENPFIEASSMNSSGWKLSKQLAEQGCARYNEARSILRRLLPEISSPEIAGSASTENCTNAIANLRGYRMKLESVLRQILLPQLRAMEIEVGYWQRQLEQARRERASEQLRILQSLIGQEEGQELPSELLRLGSGEAAGGLVACEGLAGPDRDQNIAPESISRRASALPRSTRNMAVDDAFSIQESAELPSYSRRQSIGTLITSGFLATELDPPEYSV
ncbi:uncharacterized protein VTP21DRAFT_11128 [Calcarisporiella thermophila]|uniref:uncharacterized protein n=1 Tax=Calcarisporiella thermophila TaxID=911321 RepID=UPI003744759F